MLALGLLLAASPISPAALHPWGKPVTSGSDTMTLSNLAYDCCYSPRLRVSRWVAYLYTPGATSSPRRFRGSFRADPRLTALAGPTPADYSSAGRMGLDRGHQAPDATIKRFGPDAQQETYYLSNITPQYSRVNRNIWRELESAIREWVGKDETAWVVTGPVFLAGRDTQWLGNRRVAVPHGYFCTVRRTGAPELLTLLVPNRPQASEWADAPGYLVSVDSVEKLTGLNLFPDLNPAEAQKLELKPLAHLWPKPSRRQR